MTRRFSSRVAAVFLLALLHSSVRAQETVTVPREMVPYPDRIFYNAKIVSMDDAGVNRSPGHVYEAMAIRGGRIQFLGSSTQVLRYAGPQTRKLDMRGRLIVPGLIDTHNHLHDAILSRWASRNMQEVRPLLQFFHVTGNTLEEIDQGVQLVLRENAWGGGDTPEVQWLEVQLASGRNGTGGLGQRYLDQGPMTRERLDALAPRKPVFLQAERAYLMNTAARDDFLKLFHLSPTEETESAAIVDPQIGRALLTERYFQTRVPLLADILEDGLRHFAALGITAFSTHIIGFPLHDAYTKLSREGRMPVRFGFAHRNCQAVAMDVSGCFARLGDMAGMGNEYFWNIGVTLGGLDTEPPAFCSTLPAPPAIKSQEKCNAAADSHYAKAIYTALRSHLRYVANHVKGDKSTDLFLDIIEQAMRDDPSMDLDYMRALRITADHCSFYPRQDQIPRMARLGMHLSCGPKEVDAMGAHLKVYGEQYANRIAPVKSMLEGGLIVANEGAGSGLEDVTPTVFARYVPFLTRRRADGMVVAPQEAVDRVTLLKMSTVWAARYLLREKEIGTLETGKLADFVVLNKDYFTIPEPDIPTAFPLMVVTGGKTIVLREEYAKELGAAPAGPQLRFQYQVAAAGQEHSFYPEE